MSECKKCRDESEILGIDIGWDAGACVTIEHGKLCLWVNSRDGSDNAKIEIAYCPFCGRELK